MIIFNSNGKITFVNQPVEQVWFQNNCKCNRQIATMYFGMTKYKCEYSEEHTKKVKEVAKRFYR